MQEGTPRRDKQEYALGEICKSCEGGGVGQTQPWKNRSLLHALTLQRMKNIQNSEDLLVF